MADKKQELEYVSKARTTSIKFTSRLSTKIPTKKGDVFVTLEACEERFIPDIDGVDMEKERQLLWDTVNDECDNQMQDAKTMLKDFDREKK